MSLWSWDDLQVQFHLSRPDRQTYDLLVLALPSNPLHKLGIQSVRPWWKDWKWYPWTPFTSYKPKMGYLWLVPHLPMVHILNQQWHLQSSQKSWRLRFLSVWSATTKPKISHFSWCVLFQGLPFGSRLKHLGVPDPRCPFCGHLEIFMHIFWFCRRAQQFWSQIHDFFRPFQLEPFSWHMTLLGDSPRIPFKFSQIWDDFRMEILFTLWKDKNVILFTHNSLDTNVSLYAKACICNIVLMQIQVQDDKVALEVGHLQELQQHWGNAPCTVTTVPPDSVSADRTLPRGCCRGQSSSARRSQTSGPRFLATPLVGEMMRGGTTRLLLRVMALPRGGLLLLLLIWLLLPVMVLSGLLPPPLNFLAWLWLFCLPGGKKENNKKTQKMDGLCQTQLLAPLTYGARKMMKILPPQLPLLWLLEECFDEQLCFLALASCRLTLAG